VKDESCRVRLGGVAFAFDRIVVLWVGVIMVSRLQACPDALLFGEFQTNVLNDNENQSKSQSISLVRRKWWSLQIR
jgi:hypothetical protein